MNAPSRRRALKILAAAALTAVLWAGAQGAPAWAQSLESLRLSGALGERYDGTVVVRQASAEANRIAAEVNARRQAIYRPSRASPRNRSDGSMPARSWARRPRAPGS
jgi:uncharacterized protein YdbL (DUF1318 family)